MESIEGWVPLSESAANATALLLHSSYMVVGHWIYRHPFKLTRQTAGPFWCHIFSANMIVCFPQLLFRHSFEFTTPGNQCCMQSLYSLATTRLSRARTPTCCHCHFPWSNKWVRIGIEDILFEVLLNGNERDTLGFHESCLD